MWIRREFNKEADYLANLAMQRSDDQTYVWKGFVDYMEFGFSIMGWSDGGFKFSAESGGGWLIKAWIDGWVEPFIVAAVIRFYPGLEENSYSTEMNAMEELVKHMDVIIKGDCIIGAGMENPQHQVRLDQTGPSDAKVISFS